MEPANMPSDQFLDAFRSSHGSCRMTCVCGRQHYDGSYNGGWDWEPGELESLRADKEAIDHNCTVESIFFHGKEYVMGCPCTVTLTIWEEILKKNTQACAEYLCTLAKERAKQAKHVHDTYTEIEKNLKNVLK